MVCQSPPPTMSPKVNNALFLQTPSVLTLSFHYLKPNLPHSSHGSARQRLQGWGRETSDGFVSSWLHAKLNNLNYICKGGVCSLCLFVFSSCQIREHACTRQPHYMLFGCLMRAGWKMENAPSVVCLMAGFLSSNHTAVVPGWSRQHPSAGHCREKHSFSAHIIIYSLHSRCSHNTPSLDVVQYRGCSEIHQHCAHKKQQILWCRGLTHD